MKFFDLQRQDKLIKKEIDEAIRRVLNSSVFIGGQEVEKFEKEIAKFCRVKYAVSVNSGTDALFLSLKALGVEPGDEIVTTPFTFIATAEVITNLGAKPVFVDINPNTFNINSSKIREVITEKTKGVMPVHLFGQMVDMDEIMKIAKKYKLFVIEDAAQVIGAKIKSKVKSQKSKAAMAGSVGDLGCFSFFPTKNLGAYGDGGMIVTNNKKLADKIRLLKNHGSSPKEKYLNLILGMNSRLDALQAAVLRKKLKYLEEWNKKRAKNALYYNKFLKGVGDIIVPETGLGLTHIFHQYTIRTKYRDQLKKYLEKEGIPAMIYYLIPLHLQPCFKYLNFKKGNFPEAEKAAKEVLSLPIYPELPRKDQNHIVQKIRNFYA